jgi:hypothetical protein
MCSSRGHDPTAYAGHRLQTGLATSAAEAGASERTMMGGCRGRWEVTGTTAA